MTSGNGNSGCINWGIVGTADISRTIASDMKLVADAHLRAVASRTADRAAAAAAEYGAERGCSFAELIEAPDIDAVYIGTPPATHRDYAIAAVNAGKHVLLEKPAGMNEGEVREIAAVAAARGVFAMEAMWMKFNPLYRQLKEEIAAGVIGEPRSVRASFGIPFPKTRGSKWSGLLGGSAMLDQGIYPLTLALDFLGAPNAVFTTGRMQPDGVDSCANVTLEFPGERYAQFAVSMTEFLDSSASISGTAGWTTIGFPFWAVRRYATSRGGKLSAPPVVTEASFAGYGYVAMLEAADAAIKLGKIEHELHPWSQVFSTFGLLDEIRKQLSGGRPAYTDLAQMSERTP